MPQAHNTIAAELHEAAAKSHRTAAEHHGKKDDVAGAEHCAKACSHSDAAHKASAMRIARALCLTPRHNACWPERAIVSATKIVAALAPPKAVATQMLCIHPA